MGARRTRSRPSAPRPSGQHLLRSRALADEIVAQLEVAADELVLEVGAGTGRITEPLARAAGSVVAVELDPGFAELLRRRFGGRTDVVIVEGDILGVPLPAERFRFVGNVPFALTTALLRRLLDDPGSALTRADLIVQYEATRKRASVWPGNLASLGWLPWWEFRLARRLPAAAFEPSPSVDAGVLSVERRSPPLLPSDQRHQYLSLVRTAFGRAEWPVARSLRGRVTEGAWRRLARERGIARGSRPSDLDVFDWIAVFAISRSGYAPVSWTTGRRGL